MNFFLNFLKGICYMELLLGFSVIVSITALPIVLILFESASPILMFWYLLIIPFDYAILKTFF